MARAGAVTVTAAVLALIGAQAASAATRVVDNDRKQCPAAAYTTIQAAVDAAAPNDRVSVCPGSYREQVWIRPGKEGVVVEASRRRLATILAPRQFSGLPRAIVVAQAARSVVRGFRILGPLPAYATCNDPIFTHDAGVQIGGALVKIEDNQIYDIRDNCGHGDGIWAGDAQDELGRQFGADGAVVRDNLIAQYRERGVVVEQVDPSKPVKIVDNEIAGAQSRPTIGILNGQQGSVDVEHNFIHSNRKVGIWLTGGINTGDHTVRDNRIRGNGLGIDVDGEGGSLIADNDISSSRSHGIVDHSTFGGSRILRNVVRDNNGSGLLLQGSNGSALHSSAVTSNQALRNRGDGIRVEGVGYNLTRNSASRSIGRDCRDTSGPGGPGTLGTFNVWTDNRGRTSSPAALCRP